MMSLVMFMELRLRQLRLECSLTQKQVADYLGCNQSAYSKYERGKRDLSIPVMIKLADLYVTNTDYIVGRGSRRAPYPKSRRK